MIHACISIYKGGLKISTLGGARLRLLTRLYRYNCFARFFNREENVTRSRWIGKLSTIFRSLATSILHRAVFFFPESPSRALRSRTNTRPDEEPRKVQKFRRKRTFLTPRLEILELINRARNFPSTRLDFTGNSLSRFRRLILRYERFSFPFFENEGKEVHTSKLTQREIEVCRLNIPRVHHFTRQSTFNHTHTHRVED